MTKSLEAIYEKIENQKKPLFNKRVVQVEKASFTPLVFMTKNGMGKESALFNKLLDWRQNQRRVFHK